MTVAIDDHCLATKQVAIKLELAFEKCDSTQLGLSNLPSGVLAPNWSDEFPRVLCLITMKLNIFVLHFDFFRR
jgi:hypothetical protein